MSTGLVRATFSILSVIWGTIAAVIIWASGGGGGMRSRVLLVLGLSIMCFGASNFLHTFSARRRWWLYGSLIALPVVLLTAAWFLVSFGGAGILRLLIPACIAVVSTSFAGGLAARVRKSQLEAVFALITAVVVAILMFGYFR